MNKVKLIIWGREFDLPVNYKIIDEDSMTAAQQKALDGFLSNTDIVDGVKHSVEKYVIENNQDGINQVDNIFKYVMPKCLYVPANETGDGIVIMCNFKFDIEHGMVIVFEQGKLKEIGTEDIIL